MINYFTDDKLEVQVGDIIEFPNKKMQYDQTDIVGVMNIRYDALLGDMIKLSDGYEISTAGSEFWKAKLLARKVKCQNTNT